ncbi:MAG TPA: thioredoxin family protein [Syntrophales bacterium]|jgi:small redox-active disulfide protein 2|nr:thioredoxin family protein [Syntrophales bacterium]HPI56795.1 thioredoxin family protein [Syntrophales bacterium]HPN25767.1 thioredoxin family protein [Syntrophales bacterium]HQM28732.1 thioredoxin family protein [Syntrophales bacterium]
MKIIVAGPGCARCQATEKNVIEACAQLNLPAEVTHVFDIKEYPKLGVRVTPSVLVNGKVVFSGRLPTVEEMKKILAGIE